MIGTQFEGEGEGGGRCFSLGNDDITVGTPVVLFTACTSLHCSYLLQAGGAVLNFHRQADQHAEFFAFIGQLQDLYQHIQRIVLIPKETVCSNFSR